MPTVYKRLGSSNPAATTYAQLYQVPSSTGAIVSSLIVANYGNTSTTYRIHQVSSATAIASPSFSNFIAYDVNLPARDSIALTLGITLNDQEKIGVYANSASVTFTAYGSEVS